MIVLPWGMFLLALFGSSVEGSALMGHDPMDSFANALKRASNNLGASRAMTSHQRSSSHMASQSTQHRDHRGFGGESVESSDGYGADHGHFSMEDSSERKGHSSMMASGSSHSSNSGSSFGSDSGSSFGSNSGSSFDSNAGSSEEHSAPSMGVDAGFEAQGFGGYNTEAPAQSQTRCYPHYETHPLDKCENYTEKICRTTQQEHCKDVPDKNCKGIVSSGQIRKCFNVTEIICSLKEDIKYEVIKVPYAIQKCHKVPLKVCDTVYETEIKTREAYPCLRVENPKCVNKNYPVYDKTCKSTTYFDCDTYYYGQGASIVPSKDYGSNSDAYNQGEKGSDSNYGGYEQTYCRKQPDTKCYQTPRTITQQRCYHKPEKVCEKLALRIPSIRSKQNCHTEYKKVCALEEHTEPKQVKKYIYQKTCKKVPRSICENTDVKKLVPSCVKTTRKTCQYKPVQKCETIPRKYCYKIYKKVRKDKCEPYIAPTTPRSEHYEEQHAYGDQEEQRHTGSGGHSAEGDEHFGSMSFGGQIESGSSGSSGYESVPSYKSGY